MLAECERLSKNGSSYLGKTYIHRDTVGHEVDFRWGDVNVTNCTELEAGLGDEYCAWDDSWIPKFWAEVNESKKFSMRWWAKATEGSRGMPDTFTPSFFFLKKLMSPLEAFIVRERFPDSSRLTMIQIYQQNNDPNFWYDWTHVPTGKVKFAEEWIHYYISIEMDPVSRLFNFCISVANVKLKCRWSARKDPWWTTELGQIGKPFLEAIQLSTEMLITPIEVSASVRTAADLNRVYYDEYPKMNKMPGPSRSEYDTVNMANKQIILDAGNFPNKVSMITPPLVFQTRLTPSSCGGDVPRLVAQSQYALVKAAHCTKEGMCPGVTTFDSMFTCTLQNSTDGSYFGLEVDQLSGVSGYADFLYSVADNEVLVRSGQRYDTRNFLDVNTQDSVVIVIFHLPSNGLTTVMQVCMRACCL